MSFPNLAVPLTQNAFPNSFRTAPKHPETPPLTIYIGNIPPNLTDSHFDRIIRTCGPLKKWKRAYESASFGFADFDDPFIALRAIRVLTSLNKLSSSVCLVLKAEDRVRLQLRGLEEQMRSEAHNSRRDDITQFLDKEALAKVLQQLAVWRSAFCGDAAQLGEFERLEQRLRSGEAPMALVGGRDFAADVLLENKKPPPPPPRLQKQDADVLKQNDLSAAANKPLRLMDMALSMKIINEEAKPAASASDQTEDENDPNPQKEPRNEGTPEKERPKTRTKRSYRKGHRRERSEERREKPRRHEIPVRRVRSPAGIIKSIPAKRRDLFKCYIDWDCVQKKPLLENMRAWASQKLLEFIGSSEEDITEYVVELLAARKKPKRIVSKMREILDEDAEDFVVKLLRRLHFEIISEKQKLLKRRG